MRHGAAPPSRGVPERQGGDRPERGQRVSGYGDGGGGQLGRVDDPRVGTVEHDQLRDHVGVLDQQGAAGFFGGEVEDADRRTDLDPGQTRGQQRTDQGSRDQCASELLEDQCGVGEAEPQTAVGLRQQQPEDAELGQGAPEVGVEAGAGGGELAEPLAREGIGTDLADPGAQRFLVLGRQEIHRMLRYRSRGRPRTRSPMMLRWICEVPAAIESSAIAGVLRRSGVRQAVEIVHGQRRAAEQLGGDVGEMLAYLGVARA